MHGCNELRKKHIKRLGKQMRIIRISNNPSRKEIACAAGITIKRYQLYETGKMMPRLLRLYSLTETLWVKLPDLLN